MTITHRLGILALSLLLPATAAASTLMKVEPGQVVRWPGEGIESCALGERQWKPLGDACVYAVDLLVGEGPLVLTRTRNGLRETSTITVAPYPYPEQHLTLPEHMVDLSTEDLERVQREATEISTLWEQSGPRHFDLPLHPPLEPLPSGTRFGARRIINDEPKSPHSGCDYKASSGTPLLAAANGVVAVADEHFFGGKSVFVDHGDGLITMYMHLSTIDVKPGQAIRRGEKIGEVGATGRATGPHLHFGLRWHGARVDPNVLLGLKPMAEIEDH